MRLRPERPDPAWSHASVERRTHNGRKDRMLNVIETFTRERLVIWIARELKALDVIDVLSDLFSLHGAPGHIRSCESFNAKLWDEFLDGEVFYTLQEASVAIERWRRHDDTLRPHSSLGHHPPAPEVVIWPEEPSGSAPLAPPAIVTRPTML